MSGDSKPGLAWERPNGVASGVGICLSGGGLRAAAFALGAIQALQQERGLLYGPRAARFLAAVSGGSYTAAAHAINALRRPSATSTAAPLERGSPEEDHILNHGEYLIKPRISTLTKLLIFGLFNLAALVVLFVWTGTMLADAAVIVRQLPSGSPVRSLDGWPTPILLLGLVLSILFAVRALYSDSWLKRLLFSPVALAGLLVFAEPGLYSLRQNSRFDNWTSWLALMLAGFGLLVASALVALALQRYGTVGWPAASANWLGWASVRFSGAVLALSAAVIDVGFLAPAFNEHPSQSQAIRAALAFFGAIGLGCIFSYVPNRTSLHGEYRDRVRSCFGVCGDGKTISAISPHFLLSQLGTGLVPTPQLLISATANMRTLAPNGARRGYAPFVFSHDECGVPGTVYGFATSKLELGRVPSRRLLRSEPIVTLFTAVAATGAAISPSMGRYTLPSARPILAALNLRLGRWIPNPTSERRRRAVAARETPGRFDHQRRMGPGFDELLPEMLGTTGPQVYISDGGHYDNLGLMALLRARCSEIWCVDSSVDPHGKAAELQRVLDLAREEIGCTYDFDLSPFMAGSDGYFSATSATGAVTYETGVIGTLHVIKLGLATRSPQNLKDYRFADRGFPHHKTMHQWYSRRRMEAYRDLGFASALAILDTHKGSVL